MENGHSEDVAGLEQLLLELSEPGTQPAVSKLVHLSNMGPDATSAFLDTWLEMDLRDRRRLVQELIDLAEDNVELNFDSVFSAALGDQDAEVRRAAIRGLWEHEGRDLLDSLVGLLRTDLDAGVRADAALALGRFVLQAEFDTLRATDAGRVERALRESVTDPTEPPEVRGRALEALGARSEDWVQELIQDAFDADDRRLRLSAVHAMGRSCDPDWLPTLLLELESDDAEMRYEAASACGGIADEQATPHLLPLLGDEDAEVRQAAIGALGEIGGEEAREALEEVLQSGDERVEELARAALAEIAFAEDPLGFRVQ